MVPDKLDWQVYDHCAAVTRLYAAYERFVGELVSEYVILLPTLYPHYGELPRKVLTQHRLGVGQILLKLGDKGRYKKLDEQTVVRELARGLSGVAGYSLLPDAFFIDGQNLRFDVLARLFSFLGFRNPGRFINRHPIIRSFIKTERADSSSPEKELNDFVDYRNEAAHRQVDNILSRDAMASIGRFLLALGDALADLVEEGVLARRMDLGHFISILGVNEVHYNGLVVVGPLGKAAVMKNGDEVIVFGDHVWRRAIVESIQVNNVSVEEIEGDGSVDAGLRLNQRVSQGSDIRRLKIPGEGPVGIQLQLEDALPAMTDVADTDLADAPSEAPPEGDAT